MRRTLVGLAVAVVSLVAALPASAAKPQSETFTESFSGVFESCDGFDVVENADIRGRVTQYFDQEGNVVRIVEHERVTVTFTRSDTGEVVGTNTAALKTVIDPEDGTEAVIGLVFKIKLGGKQGAIDAGRVVFDENGEVIFEAGQHDVLEGFSICEALGA